MDLCDEKSADESGSYDDCEDRRAISVRRRTRWRHVSRDVFRNDPVTGTEVPRFSRWLRDLFFFEHDDEKRRERADEEAGEEPGEAAAVLRLSETRVDEGERAPTDGEFTKLFFHFALRSMRQAT